MMPRRFQSNLPIGSCSTATHVTGSGVGSEEAGDFPISESAVEANENRCSTTLKNLVTPRGIQYGLNRGILIDAPARRWANSTLLLSTVAVLEYDETLRLLSPFIPTRLNEVLCECRYAKSGVDYSPHRNDVR